MRLSWALGRRWLSQDRLLSPSLVDFNVCSGLCTNLLLHHHMSLYTHSMPSGIFSCKLPHAKQQDKSAPLPTAYTVYLHLILLPGDILPSRGT